MAFSLLTIRFLPAQAQTDPIQGAKSAGLYGAPPDLGRNLGIPLSQFGQQVAWERFGIYFEEHKFTAFVASLDPNGAAAQQGAKVGDVLRGTDIMGANKGLNGILQAFATLAEREPAALLLYVLDADSGWQREYRLTAAAPGEQAVKIPPPCAVRRHRTRV